MKFGLWCNGSTTGFGSVCPGSNPGSPTDESSTNNVCGAFSFNIPIEEGVPEIFRTESTTTRLRCALDDRLLFRHILTPSL